MAGGPPEGRADRATLAAFVSIVLVMGMNGVAIRFSNRELDPMWGAAVRFALASALLLGVLVALRRELPRGAALRGALAWGALGFGGGYGFTYVGLVHVGAGLGQIVLALVPLMTLLLAIAVRLERFRWRGIAGAFLALAGIAVIFSGELESGVPPASLAAIFAAAACFAASNVVLKRAPRADPVAVNVVGMAVGTAILLAASLALRESWRAPALGATQGAVAYLVATSVVGFLLFMFVIARWSASATSYLFVAMPVVTVTGAAYLAGEPITMRLVAGGLVVVAGVWLGALGGAHAPAAEPTTTAPAAR